VFQFCFSDGKSVGSETNISAQLKSYLLQYTVPLHANRQTEFKEKCFNSHEPKDETVFHL
jgi:hypothetical protein